MEGGGVLVTGGRSDSLNLVASEATPLFAKNGASSVDSTGTAYSFVNVNRTDDSNAPPLWSVTTEHEFGHQFLGDPFRTRGVAPNLSQDYKIDASNFLQGMGKSISSYREGLEPRRYAAPANPEAIKPQK